MQDSWRIVLIGKSGSGKSSLANAIFGEAFFKVNHSSDSKQRFSESHTKKVNGLKLTLIDTPGIFNADRSVVQTELQSCMVECAPGPHAVILVLLVEKFTEQEQAIVDQIKKHFGEEVFRFTTVVFTHGDQLPDDIRISEFVQQSKGLRDLVQECGGRCHVVDHKYWKNNQENQYRSNKFQVAQILSSIEKTVSDHNRSFFTNAMLEKVERDIQTELRRIQTSEGLSLEESRAQAKTNVLQKYIDASKPWPYLKYAVIAGIVAVVAVFMAPRVIKFITKKLLMLPAAAPPPVVPPLIVLPPAVPPPAVPSPAVPPLIVLPPAVPPPAVPSPAVPPPAVPSPAVPPLVVPPPAVPSPAVPPPAVPPPAVPSPAVPPLIVPPLVVPSPVKEPTPPADVVEVLQEVAKLIKTVLESILERLEDLYDKIYNPFNPFD